MGSRGKHSKFKTESGEIILKLIDYMILYN